MKKIALILYYVSVVALTYTVTDRVLDSRETEAAIAYRASAEKIALIKLLNRNKFRASRIKSSTIDLLRTLTIENFRDGDLIERINMELEPVPVYESPVPSDKDVEKAKHSG